jgi:hypothetical protein
MRRILQALQAAPDVKLSELAAVLYPEGATSQQRTNLVATVRKLEARGLAEVYTFWDPDSGYGPRSGEAVRLPLGGPRRFLAPEEFTESMRKPDSTAKTSSVTSVPKISIA